MSTRATYQFKNLIGEKFTVYIHHDGYPEGASMYLYNSCQGEPSDCNVNTFIRANKKAELTGSHESHGDTEYRYNIWIDDMTKTKMIEGYKREIPVINGVYQKPQWVTIYFGELIQFMRQHDFLITAAPNQLLQETHNGR